MDETWGGGHKSRLATTGSRKKRKNTCIRVSGMIFVPMYLLYLKWYIVLFSKRFLERNNTSINILSNEYPTCLNKRGDNGEFMYFLPDFLSMDLNVLRLDMSGHVRG